MSVDTAELKPNENIRLRGAREHFERAHFFLSLAETQPSPTASYRLSLAGIYSCRAATEIMLEAATMGEIKRLQSADPKVNRDAFEAEISRYIAFYPLIERIRIHDFHRFGLVPPSPDRRETTLRGPFKLRAQGGVAALTLTSDGPQILETGASRVEGRRPLITDDDRFFDDASSKWVSLDEVLRATVQGANEIIGFFERSLSDGI